jgi:hypothetical protein
MYPHLAVMKTNNLFHSSPFHPHYVRNKPNRREINSSTKTYIISLFVRLLQRFGSVSSAFIGGKVLLIAGRHSHVFHVSDYGVGKLACAGGTAHIAREVKFFFISLFQRRVDFVCGLHFTHMAQHQHG